MAFVQPFLPAKEQAGIQKNISIYLDNSLSMSAPVGEKMRALDAGIQMVQEVVGTFPSDGRYQLITNDFGPFSNSFKTKSEVLDFLSQVRTSAIRQKKSQSDCLKKILCSGFQIFSALHLATRSKLILAFKSS
jgi:hypothetical protein